MYLTPKSLPVLGLTAFFCLLGVFARADEMVTVDFPVTGEKLVAEGLSASPRQITSPNGLGYTEVLLRPVRKTRVFLTFVFQEDAGKGLAVFWSSNASGKQVTVTNNLGDGVMGLNRRTVELPEEIGKEAGSLYIVGRQDHLLRLRIDWCEPSTSYIAADQEKPELIQGGAIKLDRDLTGQASMTPPDAWFGRVLDAALQDGVADISQDTELVVPVKGVVGEARLRAKFLGLPLGRAVRVWINGQLAGRMQPALPSLTDPGYVRHAGARTVYAGWREGALFIEPEMLKEGDNSIVFESPGKGVYLSGAAMEIEASAPKPVPEKPDAQNPSGAAGSPDPTAKIRIVGTKPPDSGLKTPTTGTKTEDKVEEVTAAGVKPANTSAASAGASKSPDHSETQISPAHSP